MGNLSTWPFDEESFVNTDGGINPVASSATKDRRTINRVLNHKHLIETVERFEWKGLPPELNTDLIERVLYYRFKGALFNHNERFIFLPFTLMGKGLDTIDSYGRYTNIVPVLFTGQWRTSGDGKKGKDIEFMSNTSYPVMYDMPQEQSSEEPMENEEVVEVPTGDYTKAVILTDSTLEVSQEYTPMEYSIRPFNEQLTDILVLVNMDLISSAKAFYIVAKDEAQKEAIEAEFAGLDRRILNGKRVTVVTSPTKLEEIIGTSAKDSARYFQSYQSIDNLRKGIIGSENGGTFMKQEHVTEGETEVNGESGDAVMNNALRMRQEFVLIANKTFGLNMSVEIKGGEDKDIVAPEGAQTKDREKGVEE